MKRKLGTLIAAFLLVSAAANSETLEERVSRLEKELAQTKVYSCQTYVTKIVKIKTLLSFWILIFLYTPVLID